MSPREDVEKRAEGIIRVDALAAQLGLETEETFHRLEMAKDCILDALAPLPQPITKETLIVHRETLSESFERFGDGDPILQGQLFLYATTPMLKQVVQRFSGLSEIDLMSAIQAYQMTKGVKVMSGFNKEMKAIAAQKMTAARNTTAVNQAQSQANLHHSTSFAVMMGTDIKAYNKLLTQVHETLSSIQKLPAGTKFEDAYYEHFSHALEYDPCMILFLDYSRAKAGDRPKLRNAFSQLLLLNTIGLNPLVGDLFREVFRDINHGEEGSDYENIVDLSPLLRAWCQEHKEELKDPESDLYQALLNFAGSYSRLPDCMRVYVAESEEDTSLMALVGPNGIRKVTMDELRDMVLAEIIDPVALSGRLGVDREAELKRREGLRPLLKELSAVTTVDELGATYRDILEKEQTLQRGRETVNIDAKVLSAAAFEILYQKYKPAITEIIARCEIDGESRPDGFMLHLSCTEISALSDNFHSLDGLIWYFAKRYHEDRFTQYRDQIIRERCEAVDTGQPRAQLIAEARSIFMEYISCDIVGAEIYQIGLSKDSEWFFKFVSNFTGPELTQVFDLWELMEEQWRPEFIFFTMGYEQTLAGQAKAYNGYSKAVGKMKVVPKPESIKQREWKAIDYWLYQCQELAVASTKFEEPGYEQISVVLTDKRNYPSWKEYVAVREEQLQDPIVATAFTKMWEPNGVPAEILTDRTQHLRGKATKTKSYEDRTRISIPTSRRTSRADLKKMNAEGKHESTIPYYGRKVDRHRVARELGLADIHTAPLRQDLTEIRSFLTRSPSKVEQWIEEFLLLTVDADDGLQWNRLDANSVRAFFRKPKNPWRNNRAVDPRISFLIDDNTSERLSKFCPYTHNFKKLPRDIILVDALCYQIDEVEKAKDAAAVKAVLFRFPHLIGAFPHYQTIGRALIRACKDKGVDLNDHYFWEEETKDMECPTAAHLFLFSPTHDTVTPKVFHAMDELMYRQSGGKCALMLSLIEERRHIWEAYMNARGWLLRDRESEFSKCFDKYLFDLDTITPAWITVLLGVIRANPDNYPEPVRKERKAETTKGSPQLQISAAVEVTRYDVVCTLGANMDAQAQVTIRSVGNGEVFNQAQSLVGDTTEQVQATLVPGIYVLEVQSGGESVSKQEIIIGCPVPRLAPEEQLAEKIMAAHEGEDLIFTLANEIIDWSELSLSIVGSGGTLHTFSISESGSVTISAQILQEVQKNRLVRLSFVATDKLESPELQLDLPLSAPQIANTTQLQAELKAEKKGTLQLGLPAPRESKLWRKITKFDLHRVGTVVQAGKYEEVPMTDSTHAQISVEGWKQTGTRLEIEFAYGWTAQDAEQALETATVEVCYEKEKKQVRKLPTPTLAQSVRTTITPEDFPLQLQLADMPEAEGLKYQWDGQSSVDFEEGQDFILLPQPIKPGRCTYNLRYTARKGVPSDFLVISFNYEIPKQEPELIPAGETVNHRGDVTPEEPEIPDTTLEAWQLAIEAEPIQIIEASRYVDQGLTIVIPDELATSCALEGVREITYTNLTLTDAPDSSMIEPKQYASLHSKLAPLIVQIMEHFLGENVLTLLTTLPGFEEVDQCDESQYRLEPGDRNLAWRNGKVWHADLQPAVSEEVDNFTPDLHLYLTKGEYSGTESLEINFRIAGVVFTLRAKFTNTDITWEFGKNRLGTSKGSLAGIEEATILLAGGKEVNGVKPGEALIPLSPSLEKACEPLKAYGMRLLTEKSKEIHHRKVLEAEEKRALQKLNRGKNATTDSMTLRIQAYDRFVAGTGKVVKAGKFNPEPDNHSYPTLRKLPKVERDTSRVVLRDIRIEVGGRGKMDSEEYKVLRQIPEYQDNFAQRCMSNVGFNGGKTGFENDRASKISWQVFDATIVAELRDDQLLSDLRTNIPNLPESNEELLSLILATLGHPDYKGKPKLEITQATTLKRTILQHKGNLIRDPQGKFVQTVINRFEEEGVRIDCQFFLFEQVQRFIDSKEMYKAAKKEQEDGK